MECEFKIPTFKDLMQPTFEVLKELGGSGTIEEIHTKLIETLGLPNEVVDLPHQGGAGNMSELQYRLSWSRTFMKHAGVITNSSRGVWAINPDYVTVDSLDVKKIVSEVNKHGKERRANKGEQYLSTENFESDNESYEYLDENKTWRDRLTAILRDMEPFAFERLSQRLLRECGFTQVEVTRKTGDGGIDGTGKLKINGIFSFNVAFQCKRYKDVVGAGDIRDFRGSLTTHIEKGVFITTSMFSKAAREEAVNPGKQQIDLIDGDELISMLAEFGIGLHEVKDYQIEEEFFAKI